jgi:hypothetical protein
MRKALGRRVIRHRRKTNAGSKPGLRFPPTRRERAGSYGKSGNIDGMRDTANELAGVPRRAPQETSHANARAAIAIAVTEIIGVLVIGTSLKLDGS